MRLVRKIGCSIQYLNTDHTSVVAILLRPERRGLSRTGSFKQEILAGYVVVQKTDVEPTA